MQEKELNRKEIIFIDRNIPMLAEFLENEGEIIIFHRDELDNNLLKEKQATALFSRSTIKVSKKLLSNTGVKYYASATSGEDHLDKSYLQSQGIHHFTALGSNANSVAEYVLYSILHWSATRNIAIKDRVIGIIGYGAIGGIVAKYCHALGLRVIVNDTPLLNSGYNFPDFTQGMELNDLIENSEIITNHVPLINHGKYKTKGLLSENISYSRKCKLFIHSSRGSVVCADSLLRYKNKYSFDTVTDVWEDEPSFNSELAKSSLISTPHVAGHSFNGKINGAIAVANDFLKYLGNNKEEIKTNLPERILIANSENLYDLLGRNRKILADDFHLKNACDFSEDDKKLFFKEYRSSYPQRFESIK